MTTITNKTIGGMTTQLITLDRAYKGLHKDYLVSVIGRIAGDAVGSHNEEIRLAVDTLKEEDKTTGTRRYSNIISALNNCLKYGSKVAEVDTTAGMTDIIAQLAGLNPKKKETTPTAKKRATTAGKKDPIVDTKDAVKHIKDEIIDHAKELTSLSKEQLQDNILALLVQVDELDFSKMDANRLALVQTYLEKVVA